MTAILVATFIMLHGPGGQIIWVSPSHVVNIRHPRGVDTGHFAPDTKCIVFTTDAKFLLTQENCETVRQRLAE